MIACVSHRLRLSFPRKRIFLMLFVTVRLVSNKSARYLYHGVGHNSPFLGVCGEIDYLRFIPCIRFAGFEVAPFLSVGVIPALREGTVVLDSTVPVSPHAFLAPGSSTLLLGSLASWLGVSGWGFGFTLLSVFPSIVAEPILFRFFSSFTFKFCIPSVVCMPKSDEYLVAE